MIKWESRRLESFSTTSTARQATTPGMPPGKPLHGVRVYAHLHTCVRTYCGVVRKSAYTQSYHTHS